MNRLALTTLVIGLLVGAAVSYGAVSFYPKSTTTTISVRPPGSNFNATLVEGNVILDAPFNGATVTVNVSTTIGTTTSPPFSETLAAQYEPMPNSSTARFTHYSGSFVAANVTKISNLGENFTLTVSYDGHSSSTASKLYPVESEIHVPVVVQLFPEAVPGVVLDASDDGSVCENYLNGEWYNGNGPSVAQAGCYASDSTLTTQLTIDPGVYVDFNGPSLTIYENGASLTNHGTIEFDSGGIFNYGALYNYGTIQLYGNEECGQFSCTTLKGFIENYDRVFNEPGGTILIGNGNNGNPASLVNYASGYNNGYYFVNQGFINNTWTLSNYGTLNNTGTIIDYHNGVLTNGGTVYNSGIVNLEVPNGGWIYTCGSTAAWNDNQPIGSNYGTNSFDYNSC